MFFNPQLWMAFRLLSEPVRKTALLFASLLGFKVKSKLSKNTEKPNRMNDIFEKL